MSVGKTRMSASNDKSMIDLYCVITDVAKEWLSILLLTVSAGLLSFVVLTNIRPLNYATSATMVVTNDNEDSDAETSSGTDVFENLNYGVDSASRLKNILESRELRYTVAKELGLKKFEGTTSAKTLGESNLLEITVRADSPYISYKETESILKNYMLFSGDLIGGTDLTVLERPKVPESPEHPLDNLKYSLIIAGVVFIMIFLMLAFISLMRDTVHNSEEAESKIDAKLLATIMHENKYRGVKRKSRKNATSILITEPMTSFQYVEDMRKLGARIINEMTQKHQKILLVSSAMENEGKTTVSANIALAMSQIDKRVVLVDMDFRKPALYKVLRLQNSDFLSLGDHINATNKDGNTSVSDMADSLLYKVPGTDLSVILNQVAVSQAVEKYADNIMELLNELRNRFDFVVVDTAPLKLVSDAEELAPMTDSCIIVVRQHWVEAREINDTIDALGGKEHMLGCVFNNARKTGMSASYGSYGYGGHYAK